MDKCVLIILDEVDWKITYKMGCSESVPEGHFLFGIFHLSSS